MVVHLGPILLDVGEQRPFWGGGLRRVLGRKSQELRVLGVEGRGGPWVGRTWGSLGPLEGRFSPLTWGFVGQGFLGGEETHP